MYLPGQDYYYLYQKYKTRYQIAFSQRGAHGTVPGSMGAYRLGDVVRSKRWRGELSKYYKDNYPKSIATEYMRKTDEDYKLDVLTSIIKSRTDEKHLSYQNSIIVHLRTGDVVDKSEYSVDQLLSGERAWNGRFYVKPLSYYVNIVRKLKQSCPQCHNITILTGFHYKKLNTDKSVQYINRIQNFFENNEYTVVVRKDGDPDDDFLIMCNSKYFVKGGGGFSDIISKIVQERGKQVYQ